VVGVPDGTNTGSGNSGDNTDVEEDPGTPAEQVDREIVSTEFGDFWRSLFSFGGAQPHESGGGGGGGQFMFASLEELDGVISQWETQLQGIVDDRRDIDAAREALSKPPAADPMSRLQTQTSRESLWQLYRHNEAMFQYASNYIAKLRASRTQMATTEDGNRDNLRGLQA
jgi:hypothetical protein